MVGLWEGLLSRPGHRLLWARFGVFSLEFPRLAPGAGSLVSALLLGTGNMLLLLDASTLGSEKVKKEKRI